MLDIGVFLLWGGVVGTLLYPVKNNDQTVSSISHLYLGEVPSDAVDIHTRAGSFYWTKRSLSQKS